MPPKTKFTKEQLIDTAFAIAQEEGLSGITIRKVASRLGCSIAPIYVNFTDVDELKKAVIEQLLIITKELIDQQNTGDKFLDVGAASVIFAKNYPLLYDDLSMQNAESYHFNDELTSLTIGRMKEDPDLQPFSDQELELLLLKMKAFQGGLSILARQKAYADYLTDVVIIQLLRDTGNDLMQGMKNRKDDVQ